MPNMVDINTLPTAALTGVKTLIKGVAAPGPNKGDASSVTMTLTLNATTIRCEPAADGAVSHRTALLIALEAMSPATRRAVLRRWAQSEAVGGTAPLPAKPVEAELKAVQQEIVAARPKRDGNVNVTIAGTITY